VGRLDPVQSQLDQMRRRHLKRRTLLADDEPAILLTMKAVFEINGFEVDTAISAQQAVAKIREETLSRGHHGHENGKRGIWV
jgi:ActR/RegA family two-component response regulator